MSTPSDSEAEEVEEAEATFDFDPRKPAELQLRRGDVVIILNREKQWWEGRQKADPSKAGKFPSNYVTLISSASERREQAKAAFDFTARKPTEISMTAGEEIVIISRDTQKKWWKAELKGKRGLIPSTHIEFVNDTEQQQQQQHIEQQAQTEQEVQEQNSTVSIASPPTAMRKTPVSNAQNSHTMSNSMPSIPRIQQQSAQQLAMPPALIAPPKLALPPTLALPTSQSQQLQHKEQRNKENSSSPPLSFDHNSPPGSPSKATAPPPPPTKQSENPPPPPPISHAREKSVSNSIPITTRSLSPLTLGNSPTLPSRFENSSTQNAPPPPPPPVARDAPKEVPPPLPERTPRGGTNATTANSTYTQKISARGSQTSITIPQTSTTTTTTTAAAQHSRSNSNSSSSSSPPLTVIADIPPPPIDIPPPSTTAPQNSKPKRRSAEIPQIAPPPILTAPGNQTHSHSSLRRGMVPPSGLRKESSPEALSLPPSVDDIPPPPLPQDEILYPFNEPDAPDVNMKVKQTGDFLGALPNKLIQWLTSETVDTKEVKSFVLAYRMHWTPDSLFSTLRSRFLIPKTTQIANAEMIKHNTLIVLREWIKASFTDFLSNKKLLDNVRDLVGTIVSDSTAPQSVRVSAQQLPQLINLHQCEAAAIAATASLSTPAPGDKVIEKAISIIDIPPEELARQVTLLEFDVLQRIAPKECLRKAWSGNDAIKRAPNIVRLTEMFNKKSRWAEQAILASDNVSDRSKLIKYFIAVSKACMDIGNFNGMMVFLSSVQSRCISRLKKPWNDKKRKEVEQLSSLIENNYRELRKLQAEKSPCVPYLGMFLTDLTFIEDGNPDFLPETSLINWTKMKLAASVIEKLQACQRTGFNFQSDPKIFAILRNLAPTITDNQAYELSLQIEPREIH